MRVALLTDDWHPTGGVASHVRLVAPALVRAGHVVLVLHAGPTGVDTFDGVEVRGLLGCLRNHGRRANLEAVPPLLATLKAFAPDVVHVHANANLLVFDAVRALYPTLKTVHALDLCPAGTKWHSATETPCHYVTGPMCVPRQVYLRCTLSKRPNVIWRQYTQADAANVRLRALPEVVVASEFVKQLAVTNGVAAGCVTVIPYFTEVPSPAAPSGSRTILFVGRVVHEKGVDLLLDALTRVAGPWRLVVVGDGIGMPSVRRTLARTGLGDRVELRGWLGDAALAAAYHEAALVVVPSRWPEPFGIVGIEAFAHVRPVVAFDTGGIPEWLRDGDGGYLAPPGDLDALGARIQQLLDAPDEAGRVAARGRERVVREFSEAAHLSRLIPAYERARAHRI